MKKNRERGGRKKNERKKKRGVRNPIAMSKITRRQKGKTNN